MKQLFIENHLIVTGVSVLLSYALSAVLIPIVILMVKKYDLMDRPGTRKLHTVPTPSMGGLAIVCSTIVLIALSLMFIDVEEGPFILLFLFAFALIGFFDDWKDLSAKFKLFLQIAFSTMAYLIGFKLDYAFGFFGVHEIPVVVSFILTIGLYIILINAYNLIDGIDGLAGGLVAINCAFLSVIFYLMDQFDYAIIAAITFGAIVGFLKYNFHPAKIFMGDSGSLPLGMLMSVFTFKIIQISYVSNVESSINFHNLIPSLIAVNGIPFFDTLRVFAVRILKGRSPFSADKLHLHHLFLKNDFGHSRSSFFIHTSHVVLIALSFFVSAWLTFELSIILMVILSILALELNTFIRIRIQSNKKKGLSRLVVQYGKKNRFLLTLKK